MMIFSGILEDSTFRVPFVSHRISYPLIRNCVYKFQSAYVHEFTLDRSLLLVITVSWEENKPTNLFDVEDRQKLICVVPESVQYYAAILKKLEKDYRVKQFFNTDLSQIQQYLFHRLKVEPTSKVEVKYDDPRVVKLTKVDENEVSQPPFSILYVSVYTSSGKITSEDPVMMIRVRYEDMQDSQQHRKEILLTTKKKNASLKSFVVMRKLKIQILLSA